MPKKKRKKRKERFDPNPELKNALATQKEVNRMHEWDDMLRRLDSAQSKLLELQLQINALEIKLKNNETDTKVLLADRDAAIRILGVVLGEQNVLLEEGRKIG